MLGGRIGPEGGLHHLALGLARLGPERCRRLRRGRDRIGLHSQGGVTAHVHAEPTQQVKIATGAGRVEPTLEPDFAPRKDLGDAALVELEPLPGGRHHLLARMAVEHAAGEHDAVAVTVAVDRPGCGRHGVISSRRFTQRFELHADRRELAHVVFRLLGIEAFLENHAFTAEQS